MFDGVDADRIRNLMVDETRVSPRVDEHGYLGRLSAADFDLHEQIGADTAIRQPRVVSAKRSTRQGMQSMRRPDKNQAPG